MRASFLLPCILYLSTLVLLFSCGNSDTRAQNADVPQALTSSSIPQGAKIFDKNCKICHGADGRLGMNGAKDLSISQLTRLERVNIITNGKNLMTPFGKILSAAEIDSVASFTIRLNNIHKND